MDPLVPGGSALVGREPELALLTAALDVVAGGDEAQGRVMLVAGEPGIGKTALVGALAARAAARGLEVGTAPSPDGAPGVVVHDDLHRAGASALAAAAALVREPPPGTLAVLVHRAGQEPAPVIRAMADAVSGGRVEHLELGPLADADADALLGRDLPRARRAELRRRAGGNPYYLLELAAAERAGAPDAVPPTVRLAIAGEIDALGAAARALAPAAAVAGERFDVMLAGALAGLEEDDAVAGADALLRAGLATSDGTPHLLAFRRPIVREAILAAAGAAWRARAHARAAELLAARDAPPAERAPHVARSARRGDAAAIAVLTRAAADVAARAPATAASWLATALRLLPDGAPADERLAVLIPHAAALNGAGRNEPARTALLEALELVPGGRPDDRAAVIVSLSRVDGILGRREAPRILLQHAVQEVGDAHAAALRLELGAAYEQERRWDEMAASAQAALALGHQRRDAAVETEASARLALAEQERGHARGAEEALEHAVATAVHVREAAVAARPEGLLLLCRACVGRERYADALVHGERLIATARRTEQGFFLAAALAAQATARIWRGELVAADGLVEEAVAEALALGSAQARTWVFGARSRLALERGDTARALQAADAAASGLDAAPEALRGTNVWCQLGAARAAAGDVEGGIALITDRAGGHLERVDAATRPYWAARLSAFELTRESRHVATVWADRAEEWARACGLPGRRADAALAAAAVALDDGRERDARTAADAAARGFRAVGRTLDAARADALAGRAALAAAGARDGAVTRLERAHEALAVAGAARDRDAVARTLREAGVHVGRPRRGGTARSAHGREALSEREREVVALVARGLTNRQIAEELFLSPKTVEHHVSRIFAKVGVRSRAALARLAEG